MLKSNISDEHGLINEPLDIKSEPDSTEVVLKLEPLPYDSESLNIWQDGYSNQQVLKTEVKIEYDNYSATENHFPAKLFATALKSEFKTELYENGNKACTTSAISMQRKKKNLFKGKSTKSLGARQENYSNHLTIEEHKIKTECKEFQLLTPLIKTNKLVDFQSYFACNSCDFYCNQANILEFHKKIHHRGVQSPICDYDRPGPIKINPKTMLIPRHQGIFYCDICTYRFKSKHNLLRHNLIHTGEKPFVCKVCDFKFNRKSNLKEHMLIHDGTKPFSCEFCDYKCFKKSSLTNHNYIHSGEKPYSCEICGHQSKSKGHFDRHFLTHSTVKPYECQMCDRKFKIKSNLKQHVLIHSGIKTINCSKCDYMCYTKSNLRCHETIRHNDKVFLCETCDSKFKRKFDLKQHMLNRHGIKELTNVHVTTIQPKNNITPPTDVQPCPIPVTEQPNNYILPDYVQPENNTPQTDVQQNNILDSKDTQSNDILNPVVEQSENILNPVNVQPKSDSVTSNLAVPIDVRPVNILVLDNIQPEHQTDIETNQEQYSV